MDRLDNDMNQDVMTEEDMREMARRYAQELLTQGVEPADQDRVVSEAKHSSHEPVTQTRGRVARHTATYNVTRPVTKSEEHDIFAVQTAPEPELREAEEPKKGLFGRKSKETETHADEDIKPAKSARSRRKSKGKASAKADDPETDLSKLKKVDLLEIMLKQGEEIDELRARVAELEAQLADRRLTLDKCGSIAEASLAITDIFKEAERAANIYLENVKREAREDAAIEALRLEKALEAARQE